MSRVALCSSSRHLLGLLDDAETTVGSDALRHDLDVCDGELAGLREQIERLVAAVAHLADSEDDSRDIALDRVRNATDRVSALASAMDELKPKEL